MCFDRNLASQTKKNAIFQWIFTIFFFNNWFISQNTSIHTFLRTWGDWKCPIDYFVKFCRVTFVFSQKSSLSNTRNCYFSVKILWNLTLFSLKMDFFHKILRFRHFCAYEAIGNVKENILWNFNEIILYFDRVKHKKTAIFHWIFIFSPNLVTENSNNLYRQDSGHPDRTSKILQAWKQST